MKTRWVPLAVPITGIFLGDWRESYVVLMAFVVPGVLLAHFPGLLPVVFLVLLALGFGMRLHRVASWWSLLRSGEVVAAETVARRPTGNGNVRLAHATAWRVNRGWFTGEVTDSRVTYTICGQRRRLEIRGLPYTSGIILAHPRSRKALCLSDLPFDLRQRDDGRWAASIPSNFWMGACGTVALYTALVVGAVLAISANWLS